MSTDTIGKPSWSLYTPRQRWGMLAVLFLVSLSNYADRQLMSVLLEPIKLDLGASDAQMGLLNGLAFAACYSIVGLPMAWLSDRKNRKIVITISLATWSIMTVLCGFARDFSQLLIARMGVGVGEAGAIPPAQSLIADYFPAEQRARALAIFMSASTGGYLVAFIGGTYLTQEYGWRIAFIALGIPGVLLCLTTALWLREPRRQIGHANGLAASEAVRQSMRALWHKKSFVLLCTSMILYFLVAYGALTWLPAYMVRVLQISLIDAGIWFGFIGAASSLIGTLGGGWLLDRISARDPRWMAWMPGALLIACWPCYAVALFTQNVTLYFNLLLIAGILLGAAVPAMFTLLHRICGSERRAMAVAIALFFSNLIGLGIGPVMTGVLSDLFSSAMGPVGLRYALEVAVSILLPAGMILLFAANMIIRDSEA